MQIYLSEKTGKLKPEYRIFGRVQFRNRRASEVIVHIDELSTFVVELRMEKVGDTDEVDGSR